MMGRGADGGCGTEERPCRPVSRVPVRVPTSQEEDLKKQILGDVDFFSQARKALCELGPYDVPEDCSALALSPPTLPRGLASYLKQFDSRKRQKKSHSGADKKSSRQSEKARGGNIWTETEEYFRDLALPDIDTLFDISSHSSLAARKSFFIPYAGNEPSANLPLSTNVDEEAKVDTGPSCGDTAVIEEVDKANSVAKEDVKEEVVHSMEDDSAGAHSLIEAETEASAPDSSSSLEWLIGSRTRILLTSERPSKKRKLLGVDAGLEKILIVPPCDGSSLLCHFCCKGDTRSESNKLISCSLCKVSVHQRCYGAQNNVDSTWVCSWCKQKKDNGDAVKPCVLCPKQGGALKPIQQSVENGESIEFAHLFCSLWMPEVYVENLSQMEPIINMGGIRETRRKLVCNVCKVKYGACIRCSHGTCRTSFHPICAKEARHRMEVWGKHGCDNVELRAFCSKHSDVQDLNRSLQSGDHCTVGSDSSFANHVPRVLSMNKSQKLKLGLKNRDRIAVHKGTPDNRSDLSGDTESPNVDLFDLRSNAGVAAKCDGHQPIDLGLMKRSKSEDTNLSDTLNLALILKKLIERGKVNIKDVASEIGISPDSLSEKLADDNLAPDMRCKLLKWLRDHAVMGTSQRNMLVRIKSLISLRDEGGTADIPEDVVISEDDLTGPVAVKSVPPRRRTKNIRILREKIATSLSDESICGNGAAMVDGKDEQSVQEKSEDSNKTSVDTTDKSSTKPDGFKESLVRHLPTCEGSKSDPSIEYISKNCQLEEVAASENISPANSDQEKLTCSLVDEDALDKRRLICSVVNPVLPDLMKAEDSSSLYVHPYIQKLFKMPSWMVSMNSLYGGTKDISDDVDGSGKGDVHRKDVLCNASVCCSHESKHLKCKDLTCKSDQRELEQLVRAENMGVLELSPEDEVEGEIIYYQQRLLGKAGASNCLTENLVYRVAKTLSEEIESAREQRWDSVLANRYLYEVKEAKKQGRKERKHKEAQAVLAAATAAAAASSRNSSRQDALEDPSHHEYFKLNSSSGRPGVSSQPVPRAKESLSRVAGPKISSEKYSDFMSDFSKEHPRSCDICRRSETILKPILVCSSCKVAVHLDCYRNVKESTGPWCCELCEDLLSSRSSGAPSVNFWDKPFLVAECGLCGGTTGAFRKSVDGHWVHAFCAEWVLESSFRRGQVNPVQGMETVAKGVDVCCVCRHKHGVCVKCSYGHCQSTFHPSCARSSGFFMNVKVASGKLQHKAYCEKHSLEQRAKAETQKHGVEELKQMKQTRVELERLRLLCDRIIKREKLKRELVLSSHEILACKRDHVTRSVLAQSPFILPEGSSESATTSLKVQTDGGYKSCSEAVQRSDDVTVDSTPLKHELKVLVPMDTDQKTDDSSTSQNLFTPKPMERVPFSGKQIPHRYSLASRNASDGGGWSSTSKKHNIETFEKELVMTSDEASMKNSRLPKGYCYIPVNRLPKEQETPGESVEHNE